MSNTFVHMFRPPLLSQNHQPLDPGISNYTEVTWRDSDEVTINLIGDIIESWLSADLHQSFERYRSTSPQWIDKYFIEWTVGVKFQGEYYKFKLCNADSELEIQQMIIDAAEYAAFRAKQIFIGGNPDETELKSGSSREGVYASIDSERDYQDKQSADPSRPDMVEALDMGGTLSAAEVLLRRALNEWYAEAKPYPKTMNNLRKVAGLIVKAGEKYGMPERGVIK